MTIVLHSALYGLIHSNFEAVKTVLNNALNELMPDGAFVDPQPLGGTKITGEQYFIVISTLFLT